MDFRTSATREKRGSPHTIPAHIGPLVRSRHATPCPTYFEVSFLESKSNSQPTRRLDAIVFRNFYCSHITIKRRQQRFDATTAATTGGGIDEDPWVTILRDRALMEHPHHEDDAQYWHVVTADEFEEFDAESTSPLRIYLYQPSPMWTTIGLDHVKVVSWSSAGSNDVDDEACPSALGEGQRVADGNLGDLCRGISEQVEIFGEKRGLRYAA